MKQEHPEKSIKEAIQHLTEHGSKLTKPDASGKSALHIDGEHAGYVSAKDGVHVAHHSSGDTVHKSKKEAVQALTDKHFQELTKQVDHAATEKRIAAIEKKHGPVPEFKDSKQAEAWLKEKHPNVGVSLEGMHESHLRVNAAQFHALASEHKWAMNPLALQTGTFRDPNPLVPESHAPSAVALKRGATTYIVMNTHRYGKPIEELHSALKEEKHTGFGAADHPESVLTHEFGHAAHYTIRDAAEQHRAKKILAEWEKATFGNKKDRASQYARTNTEEGWAESFAQMHHTPKSEWAPSTHRVAALVEHFKANDPYHKESWSKLP